MLIRGEIVQGARKRQVDRASARIGAVGLAPVKCAEQLHIPILGEIIGGRCSLNVCRPPASLGPSERRLIYSVLKFEYLSVQSQKWEGLPLFLSVLTDLLHSLVCVLH